jgi:hypothetical protein
MHTPTESKTLQDGQRSFKDKDSAKETNEPNRFTAQQKDEYLLLETKSAQSKVVDSLVENFRFSLLQWK